MKIKKSFLTCVFTIAALSSYAIPLNSYKGNDNVLCDDPIKPGPFAFTFAKDLGLSCPSDFYFNGSFLWMKPQEGGLEYAIENQSSNATPSRLPLTGGEYKGFGVGNNSWEWNPGFRVGFGTYLNHDTWNVDLTWTYVRIKDDSSYNHRGNGVCIPLWIPAGVAVNSTDNKNASARWKGDFNTIDFSLIKSLQLTRYFILSPSFAVRAAIIDQDYTARYGGSWISNTQNGAKMYAHNDYIGIGTKGGIKIEWVLGNNFNLYTNLMASLLFGKFDVSQSMDLAAVDYDLDWKLYDTVPNLETMIGINWGHFFNKNKCLFSVKAGLEFHKWWDLNRMVRFVDGSGDSVLLTAGAVGKAHNDFSLVGFNFGFQFDF